MEGGAQNQLLQRRKSIELPHPGLASSDMLRDLSVSPIVDAWDMLDMHVTAGETEFSRETMTLWVTYLQQRCRRQSIASRWKA